MALYTVRWHSVICVRKGSSPLSGTTAWWPTFWSSTTFLLISEFHGYTWYIYIYVYIYMCPYVSKNAWFQKGQMAPTILSIINFIFQRFTGLMAEFVYLLNGLCFLCSLAVWSLSLPKLQRWPNHTHNSATAQGFYILHGNSSPVLPVCLSSCDTDSCHVEACFFQTKSTPNSRVPVICYISFFRISHGRFRAKTSLDFDPILALTGLG